MNRSLLAALLAAVFTTCAAFSAAAQNVAIVNGKAVPTARVDALAKQLAKAGRPVTPEMQGQLREEVITREIFVQEARKHKLDVTDDFKVQMELARQAILIRELFNDYQEKHPITDAQAKAEYDKFVASNGGKEYRARHILVTTEDEAKSIIASLKSGGNFEEIAKKLSKDPGSGANGGELDWAPAGNYVKEFADALAALEKGKMTQTPVKTQFGYHVILLEDVRDAQLPKFDEVKPQIVQQLQQQQLAKYQQDLREKARIQ